ncbi:amino acid ABC transporter permease [Herbiconiux sp. KACC 21604]|uniref:amino acid ABC transporter permease n=1 Tax=unclassified Herbiconiux TaxID=2618217 RepID=UPI001493212C|nr:amino acid ABC transporter permease [Herbiconiux sp. SALV-R1]QJU55129.1 amino acid ABC transporter permease [Herbiconiux sp. SALV-R1]WPO86279.1 amino acid ABC transporter permease [Herbiconiux sp. KACC 21604]
MSTDLKALDVDGDVRVKHRQHPVWWVVTGLVVLAALGAANIFITNPNLDWGVVGEYFFSPQILRGLWLTIVLTVLSMAAGISIGVVAALMRLSPIRILRWVAWFYVWFFRGTPLLVQIIFWFNLAALLPEISIGVPFGPTLVELDVNDVVTPFTAALLGLALNEGAYMSEIIRGGIQSVDGGQDEAARALGMTGGRRMRRVVLPQAMRVIIPPTGNQVISMLKSSSLVSVTSLPELLYSAQLVYQRTFETIPLLVVASLWYLIVTTLLTIGQYYIERHFARGSLRHQPQTPVQIFTSGIRRLVSTPPQKGGRP